MCLNKEKVLYYIISAIFQIVKATGEKRTGGYMLSQGNIVTGDPEPNLLLQVIPETLRQASKSGIA